MSALQLLASKKVVTLPEHTQKTEIDPSCLTTIKQVVEHFNYSEIVSELRDITPHVTRILNERYSKVLIGGKSRLLEIDDNNCPRYTAPKECFIHHSDLLIRHLGISPTGKQVIKVSNVFKVYMESNLANKFDSVEFNPKYIGDFVTTKNLFTGFKCEASNIKIPLLDKASLLYFIGSNYPKALRFFEHLHDNICNGDWMAFQQFIAWLSDIINKPAVRPLFAVVMRSDEKGTGKSLIYEVMNGILGNMAFSSSTVEQVFGKHNAHLQNKLLICGEEMSWGGKSETSSKMKDAITSSTMQIEPKGIDVITVDKFYRVMLIDNSEWLVNASKDERRYLVLQVNPQQAQNPEYFGEVMHQGKPRQEVCADVFGVLSSIIHDVDMTRAYETEALMDQKQLSMNSIEQWLYEALDKDSGVSLTGCKGINFDIRLKKAEVHNGYLSWYDDSRLLTKDRYSNPRVFGRKFTKILSDGNKKILDGNNHGYLINIDLARAHFYKSYSLSKP